MRTNILTMLAAAASLAACGSTPPKQQALDGTKTFISKNLDALVTATTALQAAAPAGGANGWDASGADAAAIATMKMHWKEARTAYESIEGAIAVLFPDLDVSTDQRYDAFLSDFGPDDDL